MTHSLRQIRKIRADFLCYENSVTLPEFVKIMRSHVELAGVHCSTEEIVRSMVELFRSMDMNGDRTLAFEEFLATVVHMGINATQKIVVNPLLPYRQSLSQAFHVWFVFTVFASCYVRRL